MNIHQRLLNIMQDLKGIEKSRVNPQMGYQYRGIDDVYNELHSLFAKHGVVLIPEVKELAFEEKAVERRGGTVTARHAKVTVKYKFVGMEGDSIETVFAGEGLDTGDKALYKAYSGAQKYLLLQMFLIPTEVDEPEQDSLEIKASLQSPQVPQTPQSTQTPQTPQPPQASQASIKATKAVPQQETEPIGKYLNEIMMASTVAELQAKRVKALGHFRDPDMRAKINKAADIRKDQLANRSAELEEAKEKKPEEAIDDILF